MGSRSKAEVVVRAGLWGAALAALAYGCYFFLGFTLDDPFISFRYAENLVRGHGLVFNVGERVEGYSNLLWVLIMAALIRIHPVFSSAHPESLILAAKLLGVVLLFACVPLMLRLARALVEEEEGAGSDWLRFVPVLFLGASVCFPLWAASGLETALFAFVLLLAGDLYLRGIRGSTPCFFASAWALCALGLTRPEGFFVALAFVLHLLLWARHSCPRARLLGWLGILALGVASLTLFRLGYYGSWLPNTFFVKIESPTRWELEFGAAQAVEGLAHTLGLPVLLVTAMAFHRLPAKRDVILALLVVLCGLAFIVLTRGDWMPAYRFLVPYLPWLGVLFGVSLRVLSAEAGRVEARRGAGSRLRSSLLMIGVILTASLFIMRERLNDFRREHPFWPLHKGGTLIQTVYLETGLWIRDHVPPSALLAVAEAGAIPFLVPNPVLDMLALNDAYLALTSNNFSTDYIFSRDPEYILLAGVMQTPQGHSSGYFYAQSLLSDARLWRAYAPCRTFGPPPAEFRGNGQNFVLFARRDCSCGNGEAASGPESELH